MSNIYSNENNPATLKLILSAKFGKKSVNIKIVNLNDRAISEPRHLPYLEIEDTSSIFISNAAAWYLYPPPENLIIKVNEWLEWEATVLAPSLVQVLGTSSRNDKLKSNIITYLNKVDQALVNHNRIVEETITVCDIILWSTLYPLISDPALSAEYLMNHQNIKKWSDGLVKLPEFKDALSTFKIAAGISPYQVLYNSSKYLSSVDNISITNQPQSPGHQIDIIVTPNEIQAAQQAWERPHTDKFKLRKLDKVVAPLPGEKNILITSALPYVNNVPHLGNIIGCVLSADVFARFARLCNYNTLYIGGTDEYGTATETKALEEKLSCQSICDKYFAIHNDIYKWFNISFDHFGRTSTPQQTEICQDIFLQLNSNGFMFTDTVEQLYCEKCSRYLADRFVEGGCPHPGCNYEDARGDQCDGCGKLVNAVELNNPRCKICSNTPKLKTSAQFFFDLPKLEPLLLHWVKKTEAGWSNNSQVIARSWLREGLRPRCITRDLKWGVPVPLKDFKEKVFYVWFDAPIGYMSITKAYTKQWEDWWKPKKDVNVTLYQFMAKDNVPFHAVMFPATLLGANRGYITVSHIMATEYLNYEDGKFSKSRGVGVFGNDARDTGIPSDVWRFYLLYVRPESQDSSFSWADLAAKNNSELLNNLGNFINRALVFAKNNFNKTVPEIKPIPEDYILLALCNRELQSYVNCLEKSKLRDGIRHILSISRHGNQYMQSNQPWVLLKGTAEEKIRAGTVIGICCNIACLLSMLLQPYMPDTSSNLKKQLNSPDYALDSECPEISQLLPSGHKLGEPSPLFIKLEPSKVEELKQRFAGKQGENGQVNGTDNDIKSIEGEITKQADKVRSLKSSGVDKKIWQPEVDILLKLKKKLEVAQKAQPASGVVIQNGTVPKANPEDVKKLEEAISKQGLVVRKLKEGGANKSDTQPEINKLLELKSKLSTLLGVTSDTQKGKKSKK